jgi:hypothetical protein
MTNIDEWTPMTPLPSGATLKQVVAKINELVEVVNDLVPKHIGNDGMVEDEPETPDEP